MPVCKIIRPPPLTGTTQMTVRERVERQRFHGKVLDVVGDQSEFVMNRDGSDDGIRDTQRLSFAAVVAFEPPGQFCHGKGNRVKLETLQKGRGTFFFFRSKARADLGHVDGTARQRVAGPHGSKVPAEQRKVRAAALRIGC